MLRRVRRRRQTQMAWNAAIRGTQLLQTHLKQLSSMSQASQRPVARAAVTHSTFQNQALQRRQPQS
ncbi:hypothetical protein CO683_00005 [Bradyrhizobium ottawaense]|nr:hypothetical protein [Bradyrhizobium sp. CCBAU 25360]MDA9452125.1 hypothetical protein [Bradyrhizobium sp. CCBAU 21360]PDT71591.1 hypothetical protein CO683_00005 [Bradyrhizobium ottawaense]